jgi:glycosyltransferase involved in cell wall biosynthesis
VTFNSFEPCLTSNVAYPHKVLQYLATGIPTISTKLAGLYSCLNESAGVYWVDSPEEVFNAALKIKEMKTAQVENMISLGKKFIETQFDKTAATIGLEKTIFQAVNGNEYE